MTAPTAPKYGKTRKGGRPRAQALLQKALKIRHEREQFAAIAARSEAEDRARADAALERAEQRARELGLVPDDCRPVWG